MKRRNINSTSAYPAFNRSGVGLFFYTLRKLPVTWLALLPLLPVFVVLGVVNMYFVHMLSHQLMLKVGVQLFIALCDVVIWGAALCYLHHRYIEHPMPWSHAFAQSLRSLGSVGLLLVTFLAIMTVYYEVMFVMGRYFSSLHPSDGFKMLLLLVLIAWCFLYVLANVMLVMSFAVVLIEKESFFKSIKRSNELVQAAWLKSLFVFAGLSSLLLFVCLPTSLYFMIKKSFHSMLYWQVGFALVLVPFVLAWYLFTYNDTKLNLQAKKNSHD